MSETLFAFDEFLAAVGGRSIHREPGAISGVSIDSRTVGAGEAFFAIRGDRFDGHDFVGTALAHGAGTAVVAESRLAGLGRITGSMVVVHDVLKALELLGAAARIRSKARIAAVTGSVGKTGTKEMLTVALRAAGRTHSSTGSFNNHWGVPLSLSRLPTSARFAVFEIGMNHAGEIRPLVRLVRPHVAIITTVEAVHLEHFASVEAIAEAKAEIFAGVEPGGTAILNVDNDQYRLLARRAGEAGIGRIIRFGEQADAEAWLEKVELGSEHSEVTASILGERISYRLGAPGRHLVQNSLAVLAAVHELGGDPALAVAALAAMTAPKGRGDRHRLGTGGRLLVIDESYNANPASMRAAIALLGRSETGHGGRRIAVLGDMLELGTAELALHAGLAEPLEQAGIDRVFLAGPRMAALWEVLPSGRRGAYCEAAGGLEPILADALQPGDVVMIKGSNGSRMGPLVEHLKKRFPPETAPAGAKQ